MDALILKLLILKPRVLVMSWFVTNFVASFLLPPLSLLLLLALGILLLYRRSRFARPLILAASGLLWIAATPYFAEGALRLLEAQTTALANISRQNADAIVILGGGTYFHAPEYAGQDTIGDATLVRLRYGARLQRETGKPDFGDRRQTPGKQPFRGAADAHVTGTGFRRAGALDGG